ncbi:uncharacterized protein LOC123311683 [Coccinella septempunctata]|uniref:uncharacterized protein LOC123311683 n=1 Tax=Coccinella septempunctata TaxID=41139 RepID=UPI001D0835FF|nr:uncharacterized protein LOC123311683 [Coccinella septempunctata]
MVHLNVGGIDRDIVIASAYFAGDWPITPPEEVQRLVRYCNSRKLPIIIGCDANAHNTIWGSTNNNARGECLLEYLLANNLETLNVGTTPTFVTRAREEVLDVTIVNVAARKNVTSWGVMNEPSLCDHRIIEFKVEGDITSPPLIRNPGKTDWFLYRSNLKNNLEQIGIGREKHRHYDFEQHVEQLSEARSSKEAPWWNDNLSNLRKEVRQLFNRAKRDSNWQGYTEKLTQYNKEIRKAKRLNFQAFCENITSTPTAARLQKVMEKGGTNPIMSLKKERRNEPVFFSKLTSQVVNQ